MVINELSFKTSLNEKDQIINDLTSLSNKS